MCFYKRLRNVVLISAIFLCFVNPPSFALTETKNLKPQEVTAVFDRTKGTPTKASLAMVLRDGAIVYLNVDKELQAGDIYGFDFNDSFVLTFWNVGEELVSNGELKYASEKVGLWGGIFRKPIHP